MPPVADLLERRERVVELPSSSLVVSSVRGTARWKTRSTRKTTRPGNSPFGSHGCQVSAQLVRLIVADDDHLVISRSLTVRPTDTRAG